MIQIPDELQGIFGPLERLLEESQRWIARMGGGRSVDYAQTERDVADRVAAIERAVHQALLGRLDVDCERVQIKGHPYTRVGRYEATYYTLAGPVAVERSLYRQDGVRGGKTVDAVSLRAGVVEAGWLPQTAAAMAHLM